VLFLFSKRTGKNVVEVYKVYYKALKRTSGERRIPFYFWQQWLFYSSLLFAVGGLVVAVDGNSFLFLHYNEAIAQIFWNTSRIPESVEPFRLFILGPLGATIAGCYVLLAYIAYFPFRRKERWARNAIVMAFGAWALIDTAVCLFYGVYFQAYVVNLFSILVKALPLIFTWKDFNIKDEVGKQTVIFPFFKN
jgi:hypothetical protein